MDQVRLLLKANVAKLKTLDDIDYLFRVTLELLVRFLCRGVRANI